MSEKFYNNDPAIGDIVVFDLQMTDSSGIAINPYKVNQVVIYFAERDFMSILDKSLVKEIGETDQTQYYKEAIPIAVYGSSDEPAWIGSNTDAAYLTREDFDDDGESQIGVFRLKWETKMAKEGDYFLCYSWTPVINDSSLSNIIQFYLNGNTKVTTSIPSHFTDPIKYETLFDRYLPEMFKMYLSQTDLTPDVLNKFNSAIAKTFTQLENLVNQLPDLIDANAVADSILPYLGNMYGIKLKGLDQTLWRRQIKTAIVNFKKKGTLSGITEALASAGMTLKSLYQYWQVMSGSVYTESFLITEEMAASDTIEFTLTETPLLPIDDNFEVAIRFADTSSYVILTVDYVSFSGNVATWVGENLSFNPISLEYGDIVKIIYKYATVTNQSIEDYLRTLPIADARDEADVTYPKKNWNVKLILETDSYFDLICTSRHPFAYDVVFGKVRTEFPYGENIYNMDEYNGSVRDSTNPCDLDKDFLDSCSCCIGSKFVANIEINDISADRMNEASEILTSFMPFHAVAHQINYSGGRNEFMPSPMEEIDTLLQFKTTDNVIATQMNFNRIIEEGGSDADELKRNMLAEASTFYSGSGMLANRAIVIFSPGIKFDAHGIDVDGENNHLEILSGVNSGDYKISAVNGWTAEIDQDPDSFTLPLNTGAFTFRISNVLYSQSSASVYQDNLYGFSDADVSFGDYGIMNSWSLVITAGIYAGTYTFTVNTDGTLLLNSSIGAATGISYTLKNEYGTAIVTSSTGKSTVTNAGRVEIDKVCGELGIIQSDYVMINSIQYLIKSITRASTADKIYIEGYAGGDIVPATIYVYRRLVGGTGYLDYTGLKITGTVPTIDYTVEGNQFRENYVILVGSYYYQIESIDGSEIILNGKSRQVGLDGTSTPYSIIQLSKVQVTTQDGTTFARLDRRGNESIEITTETASSMSMELAAAMFNGEMMQDNVQQSESIWYTIEHNE